MIKTLFNTINFNWVNFSHVMVFVALGFQRRTASIIAEGGFKVDGHHCSFPGCDSKGMYSVFTVTPHISSNRLCLILSLCVRCPLVIRSKTLKTLMSYPITGMALSGGQKKKAHFIYKYIKNGGLPTTFRQFCSHLLIWTQFCKTLLIRKQSGIWF